MKKIVTTLNDGSLVEGFAVESKGVLWAHVDGETFVVKSEGRKQRGKGGASANPGDIVAPMPGKIIKLLAAVGSEVKAGQVLLVMEAMKMEYTLKAQANGKVLSVHCAVNDQVTLGQHLAKLEVES